LLLLEGELLGMQQRVWLKPVLLLNVNGEGRLVSLLKKIFFRELVSTELRRRLSDALGFLRNQKGVRKLLGHQSIDRVLKNDVVLHLHCLLLLPLLPREQLIRASHFIGHPVREIGLLLRRWV